MFMKKMTFGQRFKYLRVSNGLTQDELVAKYNHRFNPESLTKPAISQYENDKRYPETDTLIRFAELFDVTTDFLLGVSDVQKCECKEDDLK